MGTTMQMLNHPHHIRITLQATAIKHCMFRGMAACLVKQKLQGFWIKHLNSFHLAHPAPEHILHLFGSVRREAHNVWLIQTKLV